jgi:WS/DGAT C-terminal domain
VHIPLAPLAKNTAIGIAAMSHNGKMGFGINADYDAIPDPGSRNGRLRIVKTE